MPYAEYREQCLQFEKEYKPINERSKHDKDEFTALEKDYWMYVDHNYGAPLRVSYAADLPADKFGSGFPTDKKSAYGSHPWNLNFMKSQKDSLLQFYNRKISGITVPWVYSGNPNNSNAIGMLFSSFCWHLEDLLMYSLNYMHAGAPKIWYSIPADDARKFERTMKEKLTLLFAQDPNILLDIITMISPSYLVSKKVLRILANMLTNLGSSFPNSAKTWRVCSNIP